MFPPVYPGQLLYLTCMFTVLLLLGYYSGTKLHCITLFNNVILICIPNLIGTRHLLAVVVLYIVYLLLFVGSRGLVFLALKVPGRVSMCVPVQGLGLLLVPVQGLGYLNYLCI